MPRKTVAIGNESIVLDARPDRLDLRDRPYQPLLGNLPSQHPTDEEVAQWLPQYAELGLILDQGAEGACTGFGLAAVINYLRFRRAAHTKNAAGLIRVSPAMLYQLARLYDEWPGEDYEGSSCRGALKGWHRHGVCRELLWPYAAGKHVTPAEDTQQRDDPSRNWDVDALDCTLGVYYRIDTRSVVDMQAAIHEIGAIYVSATVHEGWGVRARRQLAGHADLVRVAHVPKPKNAGGHAFALVGYNDLGFVVQNSWGDDWGSRGFALLPYEDWVTHGEDAWVFTLGVPRQRAVAVARKGANRTLRSPRFLVPSVDKDTTGLERPVGLIAGDDAFARRYRGVPLAVQPLETDAAYRHTIVLDRGFPVRNDITAEDPAAAVAGAAFDRPRAWMNDHASDKLLIYAHGGLNSEGASITRIRAIAPYALNAGLYPLFITWRSGALETVSDLVEETFARTGIAGEPARGWTERITEKTDRLLEPLLRGPGGALWGQMKLNADRASEAGDGGVRLMVERLKDLAQARPKLEIHMIGHSAGAIVLGAMLAPLHEAGLKVASLRLFAPACTIHFALDHYKRAVDAKTLDPEHWHIHVLSDKNERDDSVGPYRKSLLYLVSRAFEDIHKTPLLGMDRAFDPSFATPDASDDMWAPACIDEVRDWLKFWSGLGIDQTNRADHVLSRPSVSTGADSIPSAHGCFDNAVDIMGDALGYAVDPSNPVRVKIYRLDY
ncbi:MAG TPA: C1 family peptidase [Burkholderiales bacterium]|nr:C1 family peptidase [Betaproteobacteria bacterium]HQR52502.1 C1 family peptidase [Burkholderiales bacterium]